MLAPRLLHVTRPISLQTTGGFTPTKATVRARPALSALPHCEEHACHLWFWCIAQETDVQVACHRVKPPAPDAVLRLPVSASVSVVKPAQGRLVDKAAQGVLRYSPAVPLSRPFRQTTPRCRSAASLCADSRRRGSPLHGMSKDHDAFPLGTAFIATSACNQLRTSDILS